MRINYVVLFFVYFLQLVQYNRIMETDLNKILEDYEEIREISERGICGLYNFMFTTGLVIGITKTSYTGRYCFPSKTEAIKAIRSWDGTGDPIGDWIKYKGYPDERSNPNYGK